MGGFWDAMGNASKNIWDGADVKGELDAANTVIIGQ
jgi:arabinogalactan oligomer/maltooligosaccharide transport system substrate-binding protein